MKNLEKFIKEQLNVNESINESVTTLEVPEVAVEILELVPSNIDLRTGDKFMDYADEREIANALQEDEDVVYDFIQDNYDALVEYIHKHG